MAEYKEKIYNQSNSPNHQINVYSENPVYVLSQKQVSPYKTFGIFNDMNLIELVKLNLSGSAINTFLYMVGNMDYENEILFNQTSCAKELNISRDSVTKSVKILLENNLIKKIGQNGTLAIYLINPSIFYRGKAKAHGNVLDKFLELEKV